MCDLRLCLGIDALSRALPVDGATLTCAPGGFTQWGPRVVVVVGLHALGLLGYELMGDAVGVNPDVLDLPGVEHPGVEGGDVTT